MGESGAPIRSKWITCGSVTSPDSLGGPLGALGVFASVYSSIGGVCEGNTDTISARQVSVGMISGGQQCSGARPTGTNLVSELIP